MMTPIDGVAKRLREWVEEASYPGYTFRVDESRTGAIYLQAAYREEDTETGAVEEQLTRRWFLSPHMTKSEVIGTMFLCVMTSMEHRVREWFHYQGRPVFHPHHDVDALAATCGARQERPAREPASVG